MFAFADSFLLDPTSTSVNPRIRALRTPQYTYAVYFSTVNTASPFEYELYDNLADPLQMVNLLYIKPVSKVIFAAWIELDQQLQIAMRKANVLRPNVPWQPPLPG